MRDHMELLVYLILRSRKEVTLDELAREAGVPRRGLSRILRSLARRGVAERVGDKVVFKRQDARCLRVPFAGGCLDLRVSVNVDLSGAGEVEVYKGDEIFAVLPYLISSGSMVVDLSGLLRVYGDAAKANGDPFSLEKAYAVFRRVMEGKGEAGKAGQWEIDAALAAIVLCGAITEKLGLEYIFTTIDSESIPRRVRAEELQAIGEKHGVEFKMGYAFPLGDARGMLLVDRGGKTYFLKEGGDLIVEVPIEDLGEMVEVDFTSLVESYLNSAVKKESGFSAERVVDHFFSMLEKRESVESYAEYLEYEEEKELLEAMYRISLTLMRLKDKDVSAKVTYPCFSGEN